MSDENTIEDKEGKFDEQVKEEESVDWKFEYLLSFGDDRNYDIHINNDQISLFCNTCHADYNGSVEKLFLDFWTGTEIDLCDCKEDEDEFESYFESDSDSSF